MKKIVTRLQLYQGIDIPKWYGIAYVDHIGQTAICYPIPFNVAVRAVREVYYSMMHGLFKAKYDSIIQSAYDEGYKAGQRHGR